MLLRRRRHECESTGASRRGGALFLRASKPPARPSASGVAPRCTRPTPRRTCRPGAARGGRPRAPRRDRAPPRDRSGHARRALSGRRPRRRRRPRRSRAGWPVGPRGRGTRSRGNVSAPACDASRVDHAPRRRRTRGGRSARALARFRRPCDVRSSIAIRVAAFPAAPSGSPKATTSGIGPPAAPPCFPISFCCADGITARCTKTAIASARQAGSEWEFRRPDGRVLNDVPSTPSGAGRSNSRPCSMPTPSTGSTSTRRPHGWSGWESASTWATRSRSCIPWPRRLDQPEEPRPHNVRPPRP